MNSIDWTLVPVCGVAGGALGALFTGSTLHFGQRLRHWIHFAPMKRTLVVAGACGIGVALLGLVSGGQVFGTSIAGYFSGVVQAPMTAFVIIIAMTGDHRAVIPIMATAMIGYLTSRILSREPLYHGLSQVLIAAALRWQRAKAKAHQTSQLPASNTDGD